LARLMTRRSHITLFATILLLLVPFARADCLTGIVNVRHWTGPDYTRVVIDVGDKVKFKEIQEDHKLSLELQRTSLPTGLTHQYHLDKPAVKKVLLSPRPGDKVMIELWLGDNVRTKVFTLGKLRKKKYDRIVIDVMLPEVEKKESKERQEERQLVKVTEKKKVIVIDPGHGGEDPGAVGRMGTKEKDIVLRIATQLRSNLRRKGYQAYLTREGDYYVSFKKRLQIAREYGADLFLSIHTDSHRSRGARGASVYCLSPRGASSEAARLLAKSENLSDIVAGVPNGEKNGESDPITLNMLQTETINQSKCFGLEMLSDLKKVNRIKYNKVHGAPFRVLKLPDIPSALVEVAYISNPREERLLRTSSFRRDIAWALTSSIDNFMPLPATMVVQSEIPEPRHISTARVSATSRKKVMYYTVRKGDYLEKIADEYDLTVGELMRLNRLRRKNKIYVGQKLRVSGSPPRSSLALSIPTTTYRVKRGDTLGKIAYRYDTSIGTLARLNNLRIRSRIYVNQGLKVPRLDGPEIIKGKNGSYFIYVVKRGDFLKKIAQKHNTSMAAIMKCNSLRSKNRVYVGQRLKIPLPSKSSKIITAGAASQETQKTEKVDETGVKFEAKALRVASSNTDDAGAGAKHQVSETDALQVHDLTTDTDTRYATYIVKKGDILEEIARKYHTTQRNLINLNTLKSRNRIYADQTLKVPALEKEPGMKAPSKPTSVKVNEIQLDAAVVRGNTGEIPEPAVTQPSAVTPDSGSSGAVDFQNVKKDDKGSNDDVSYAIYVVKRGDILERIAQEYNTTPNVLRKLNHLKSRNRIYVNQKLKVPSDTVADTPSTGENTTTTYIVKRGDILERIARKYNTTPNVLRKLNHLKSRNRIYVNQKLKVPSDAAAEPSSTGEDTTTYIVKRGDTLDEISFRYNTTIRALKKLNHMGRRNRIYIGQRLKVPYVNPAQTDFSVYVVKRGDKLAKIAGRHKTTVAELRKLNNLRNRNYIYIGQRLKVPSI